MELNGIIVNASASNQTVNLPLVLGTVAGSEGFTFTEPEHHELAEPRRRDQRRDQRHETLTVDGAGSTSISGGITNGAGSVVLTKDGTGTLTLSGTTS